MKRALTPRDRRAMLLGLILLVPGLLYVWGVKPYVAALTDARHRLAASQTALARDLALVKLAPESDALRIGLDSVLKGTEARLFAARDAGMAAGELGSYVAELARDNQVWLQAATARETEISPSGMRTLGVDIRAESDFQGIVAFLRALESGERLIRVDQLSLVPAVDTSVSPQSLQLRATVRGFTVGVPPPARRTPTSRKRS